MLKQKHLLEVAIWIFLCEIVGFFGSFFTVSAIPTWYTTLEKPILSPPSWLFAPVWTILYLFIGIAAFLIWRIGWKRKKVRQALALFFFQLMLNGIWSPIFFGLHSPLLGLVDMVALWLMILWTTIFFWRISKPASYLFIPYLLWVSFALYLNWSIWILNSKI